MALKIHESFWFVFRSRDLFNKFSQKSFKGGIKNE